MMLLSEHPEVLQKLREEHECVFPGDLEATIQLLDDSPEKLGELEYTDSCIREAMRLYPIGFSPLLGVEG
jgi:cytochrome P450